MKPLPQPPEPEPSPIERLRSPARRNTILGGLCILVSALILAAGVVLAGPGKTFVALFAAIAALGVLWFLWQLGITQQPRGLFLAIALTTFAALMVPLAVGVVQTVQRQPLQMQTPVAQTGLSSPTPAARLPRLSDSFKVDRPDPETDSYVEVLKDSKIKIEDRYYRINSGERFLLRRVAENDVIFKTRDFLISLPKDAVAVHLAPEAPHRTAAAPPAPAAEPAATQETPPPATTDAAEVTRTAQANAIKYYPALAIKDSRENRTYVEAYEQLKRTNPDFFKDPEWPLQLAEALAERDGWTKEAQ